MAEPSCPTCGCHLGSHDDLGEPNTGEYALWCRTCKRDCSTDEEGE